MVGGAVRGLEKIGGGVLRLAAHLTALVRIDAPSDTTDDKDAQEAEYERRLARDRANLSQATR